MDNPTLGHQIAKLIPTMILAALTAGVTTWLAIRDAQQEMRFKVEVMDQAIKAISTSNAQNAAAWQTMAIKQAEQAKDIEMLKDRRK